MDDAALAARLEEARKGLLDLSTRNRLLALPKPGRSRGVVLLDDEDADFVLAELLAGRAFGFEAAAPAGQAEAPQPARRGRRSRRAEGVTAASATRTREEWQADRLLRARLAPEEYARRLRDLMSDARTAREETGIATLSLGIGTLAWRDPATPATERLAPLALLPVALEREGVSQTFRLRAAGLEVQENLSLAQKLAAEFRVALPAFDPEEYDPTRWAEAVAAAIGTREGWAVDPDGLCLGLFSFQKFLMWRDLDPAANPGLAAHPVVRALVGGASLAAPPPFADDADVDSEIRVERLDHIMEVDGSQALAAEAVRRGEHVVIQGPPGTGKSQTILNIIAQAVLDGRTVLFVAEKLAALEVVRRRLGVAGLGAACLELHAEKQSKRAVLDELRATLALPPVPKPEREALVTRLGALRARLNGHAAAMAGEVGESGRPLHAVVGNLVALRARGQAAPDFRLPVAGWDTPRLAAAERAVEELAIRAGEGGPRSPWRGVTVALAPTDRERLLARLPTLIRALAAGGAEGPRSLAARRALQARAAGAPRHDAGAMAHPAWAEDPAGLRALAEAAAAEAAAARDPRLLPGALEVEGLAEARATLAAGGGLFGFLSAALRQAKAVAARVARDTSDPLPALDAALAGQAARRRLREGEALGRGAFGALWGDAAAMLALVAWREAEGAEVCAVLARGGAGDAPTPTSLRPPGGAASPRDAGEGEGALAAWEELLAATGLDVPLAFGTDDPALADIAARLADWAAAPEGLSAWLGWRRAMEQAGPELAPLAERLADARLAPEDAAAAFAFARDEALLKAAMRARPELAAFDGAAFDRLVADFAEADRARIELARRECAWVHAEALARVRAGMPGYAVLQGEFEKKRGHLPVRELLSRAGKAVQAAKPVFMMSPLSVAQFLAPATSLKPGLAFDLLVIDEASQVEPVDALGAIARCRQIVVVGDDRQMPPTRFFQRMTSEDESDAPPEGPVAAREVESILGLANARGVPNVMLRWHYRSRHESLIATSNAEFYGNRLVVLPSPKPRSDTLGLRLVPVAGKDEKGVNPIEAEAVAQAVIAHARGQPGDSLGVAAFAMDQRDAIIEALEKLRRDNPDTDAFFAAHPDEPFFVKNLENVQGDERDAILISVGFARGENGRLAQRFGPVSAEGGERRLNVLITRAKKRCVVFSSIGADDIDLARSDGVGGEKALKAFLHHAATTADTRRTTGEDAAAPLAGLIAEEIRATGKGAVARIGSAGLFLDVAAKDGADFVLGVETDGGDWARLRAARDRERGRPGALGMMGWTLHRAWSLAWLARPEAERARLRAALGVEAAAPPEAAAGPDPGLAQPYAEAAVEVPRDLAIPAVPFARLSDIVAAIIRAEQPVHGDAVLERARLLWERPALDAADRAALRQALRLAAQLQGVGERDGFWSAEDAPPPAPRDRRAAAAHLRRGAMVAPAEIEAACRALLGAMPVATEAELAAGVVRLLGLEANAAGAVAARVAGLVGSGRISLRH